MSAPGLPIPPRRAIGSATLALAFLTLLVVGTDLFVVSPLLPDIADEYGIRPGVAGNAVTAFSLAYMIAAPFAGAVADRVGRRPILAVGLAAFALANTFTASAPTFPVLLIARASAGIAASSITPSVLALVGQSAPPARRASWMSAAMAGFLVSLTTGAPCGTAAAAAVGWRSAFLGIGALALVLSAVNVVAWRGIAGAGAPPAVSPGSRVGLLTKIRAVSVTGVWALSVYVFYTYLGTALGQEARFSTGQVELALMVFGVGAVVGSLGGGRLADRFGAVTVTGVSFGLLAVAHLLIGVLLHAPKGLLGIALVGLSLAAYPCLPAYQSRLVTHFGPQSGSVLAWNSCFMYLGTSLAAALGGAVLSRGGFAWITVIGGLTALVGIPLNGVVALGRQRPGTAGSASSPSPEAGAARVSPSLDRSGGWPGSLAWSRAGRAGSRSVIERVGASGAARRPGT